MKFEAMFPIRVPPTDLDQSLADAVARNTRPPIEEVSSALTWGADEHLLVAAAAIYWIASRSGSLRRRARGKHLLALSVASGVAPHLMKHLFNQRRPDRVTAIGHLHGVPLSGKAEDAFPSGHAVHMGALASAACDFSQPAKIVAWTASIGLSVTRIGILAHWTSDVIVGFVGGFAIDRLLRRLTGYPGTGPDE
jgi:membrane-associated phospholipid phosphatase